ncbi:hypothetical protein M0R45_016272 [Rubus argutus]|uniref:Secreted protein n=1 Tax=Rubus argutus TaxID=59490 RepID=A0AAW1XTG6_RUBAR
MPPLAMLVVLLFRKLISVCVVAFQCDLLGMPPVAQLEKDAKHALAYQLLKIFNFDSEAGCLLEVSGRKFYSSEKLCRSTQRVFGKEQ